MADRDYGVQQIVTDRGVVLECKYYVPGLTLHDLAMIYDDAVKEADPADHLSGNPSVWPTNRGLKAVVDAVIEAYEKAGRLK